MEFIYEMGALRFMDRSWKRFLNADFANNTEHMYRVVWIALVLAKHEGVKDTGKVVKMAIAHDIAESRTGDVDYLSRQYVDRNEHMALEDILDDTSVEAEFKELLHEYEVRESIESRIVKDADNLDVDFELREQTVRGHDALGTSKNSMREHVHKTKLYTDTAKKIAAAIKDSNPHSWHANSARNRFSGGDWKK